MKKIINLKSIVFLTMLLAVFTLFTGCGQNEAVQNNNTPDVKDDLKGRVTISGSTSVQPLAQVLADEFMVIHPGVTVDVQAGGSSTGVKNANSGATDIGNASRELKDTEKAWGVDNYVIAVDGIAVVVNPNNSVNELTSEQVQKIFKGEITNWKEVGGDDAQIIVISREEGSGTRGAFEELLKLLGENEVSLVKPTIIANENGTVKADTASKKYAIGYVSLGYLDSSVKPIKLDGADATIENIKNKSYTLWRPFNMITKGDLRPEVKAFLDYVLGSEGQQIVVEDGYISADAIK